MKSRSELPSLVTLVFCSLCLPGAAATQSEPPESAGCRIYMAPSSLKGVNGLGIYTTRPIEKDEPFLNAPDGPSVAVLDYHMHSDKNDDPLQEKRNAWINLFDDYWWGRGVPDQVAFESTSTIDFQITFGSLPNHHCVLVCCLRNNVVLE